jgi:biotin-(acetyl-CoA carboxylase) ligase
LARVAVWYHALGQEGAATVLAAWRARSVPWWGRPVEVRSGQGLVRGVARGVDERGALLLDLEGGARAALLSGEARELRLAGE